MKKIAVLLAALLLATLAACSTKADTVNHNLDKDAEGTVSRNDKTVRSTA